MLIKVTWGVSENTNIQGPPQNNPIRISRRGVVYKSSLSNFEDTRPQLSIWEALS
jgi:hypothetical protein